MELPHGSINPRIVIGFDGQIKLMVDQVNNEKWDEKDFNQLERCKIQYLEERLGYKILSLETLYPHNEYEKILKQSTNFCN